MAESKHKPLSPFVRLGLDLGPLVIFFIANAFGGIFVGTAVFMAVMVVAVIVGFVLERRISPMPLVTGALVLVFGGLTLWLADETFIKIKPTILYAIFAVVLAGGLAFGRTFLKALLSVTFHLPDRAWRTLTWRWAVFFAIAAIANEIVWRHTSTDMWLVFKVWVMIPLTLVFAFAQTPFLLRNQIEQPPSST